MLPLLLQLGERGLRCSKHSLKHSPHKCSICSHFCQTLLTCCTFVRSFILSILYSAPCSHVLVFISKKFLVLKTQRKSKNESNFCSSIFYHLFLMLNSISIVIKSKISCNSFNNKLCVIENY